MTTRKLLLLAALCAALLFYIAKIELVSDQAKHSAEQPLLTMRGQSVERIEIKNEQGTFALVNAAPEAKPPAPDKNKSQDDSLTDNEMKSWSIEHIKGSELDRGVLNTLLATLRNVKLEDPIPADETDKDLTVYGLSESAVSAEVKATAVDRALAFGKLNSFVTKRYMKQSTAPEIYLVSDDLYKAINKPSSEFRNHLPISVAAGDVQDLTLVSSAGTVTLHSTEGMWKITAPGSFAANDSAVGTVLRDLRNVKVKSFIDGAHLDDPQFGLNNPIAAIAARGTAQDGSKVSLDVNFGKADTTTKAGKNETLYYMSIAGRDPVFVLEADPTAHFVKSATDLRLKQLVKFPIDRMENVEVAVAGRDLITLVRKGSDWTVNGKDGDTPFIEEFLHSVSDLEASDFPAPDSLPELGFESPTAHITCTLRPIAAGGTPEKKSLIIGKQLGAAGYAAVVEGSKEPFAITTENFKKMAPHYEALEKPEPPAAVPTVASAATP